MSKCPKCEGTGSILLIMKSRSVGISTMIAKQLGNKVKCPDCEGTGESSLTRVTS